MKDIPTRFDIQNKINQYYTDEVTNMSVTDYVSSWLDSLDLPETVVIAQQPVNPKQQILDDLDSYNVGFPAQNL